MHSPLRQLVGQTLVPFHRAKGYELTLANFDAAAPIGREALVGAGTGLDLYAGERVLGAAQLVERPRGHEHRLTLVITDRQSALAGWSTLNGPAGHNGTRFVIPHAQLHRVDDKKAGLIESAHIALTGPQGVQKLVLADIQPQLAAFYQGLLQLPPATRCEPPTPFVTPSEEDPCGAQSATAGLWVDDPQARELLAAIQSSLAAGMPAEMASDLVTRAVLAHRSVAAGPMMQGGRWVSALGADDFGHTLTYMLGAPVGSMQPSPGVHQLDFRLDPRRDYLGAAATALGVASFVFAGVGIKPGAVAVNLLAGRKPVTQLRVVFADQRGGTAFQCFAPSGPLEHADGRLATALITTLMLAAYPVLLRRAQRGFQISYQELMAS